MAIDYQKKREYVPSKKEAYVDFSNIDEKTGAWLKEAESYCGAKHHFEFRPNSSCLLLIDCQRFFLDPSSPTYLPASEAIVPRIQALLAAYRERNLPILFTRHGHKGEMSAGLLGQWWGNPLMEDDPLADIDKSLEPRSNEHVLGKERYSAFNNPDLEIFLKVNGIKQLVIAGVMTHLCCETTAREAFMKDYLVHFVVDGTATQNEDLHLASIKTLSNGFARPVTAQEIIGGLE